MWLASLATSCVGRLEVNPSRKVKACAVGFASYIVYFMYWRLEAEF